MSEHVGPIVPEVPNAGCNCKRCATLRALPDTGPDHVGAYTLDKLEPSNATCVCRRCGRLRSPLPLPPPARQLSDLETIKAMLARANITFEESVPYVPHGGVLERLANGGSIIEVETESGVSFFFRRAGESYASDAALVAMWSR